MSTTLTDLIALVNSELENHTSKGTASAVGDDQTLSFYVAPPNRTVLADQYFSCFVDGVEDATGSMDYVNGIYTFPAVQTDKEIKWTTSYKYWTDAVVTQAIKTAVNLLFPHFYVGEPVVIATNGTLTEFEVIAEGLEFIQTVEFSSTSAAPWSGLKRARYAQFWDGDKLMLRFYTAPGTGSIRVHTICRPGWVDEEVEGEETPDPLLATLNIPDRATAPIVSYCSYYLLTQKVAPRMRLDIAVATTGGGNLSPRQMNDASNSFYLRFQMQLQANKMHPWSGL